MTDEPYRRDVLETATEVLAGLVWEKQQRITKLERVVRAAQAIVDDIDNQTGDAFYDKLNELKQALAGVEEET